MKTWWALGALTVIAIAGLAFEKGNKHDFVAHEWGTFTSIQGADGVLLDWHPLQTTDLPKFVYNWSNPGLNRRANGPFTSKARTTSLQRMETPVIYFYSDDEMSVDVSVNFPKGVITEWYPQAQQIGPSTVPVSPAVAKLDAASHKVGVSPNFSFASLFANAGAKESRVRWANVKVLPSKEEADMSQLVTMEKWSSHYFAARETDADILRINSFSPTNPPEHEKFLFYRGVGSFPTPLSAKMQNDEILTLANFGKEALKHLFVLEVRGGQARLLKVDQLSANGSHELHLSGPMQSLKKLAPKLMDEMAAALAEEGLYPREATAMVNTWKDSWFAEEGLRVLYVLPRAWTDETLPITLRPEPCELVRVMVGRAEIITPAVERGLRDAVVRAKSGDAQAREEAIAELQKLGRFAEPAIRRITAGADRELSQNGWSLLQVAAQGEHEKRAL
jgi:hypothetical protein